jgi:transcriptional regulator with XRE-family HTH domain
MLRIHAERLRRGWTQTALAYHAGKLSPADISRIENGWLRPYPRQLNALSEALNVPADQLLDEVTHDGKE